MSACEQCWEEASRHVLYMGGSVVDHYYRLLVENENAGHELTEGQS